MTNMQLYLAIGVPTLMVLLGLLLNWSATKELSNRVSELGNRFGVLEGDMRQFYHLTGKLEGRLEAMEKGR